LRLTAVDLAPVAERGMGTAGQEFGPEEIAQLLERWRPEVLRRMRARRLWRNAPPADHEDQFQDVALVLCTRVFRSEEHLRRALWTGLGFRARDFWKAGRRRELPVADFFDDVRAGTSWDGVAEDAATAADGRYVDDCLSELDARERAVYRLAHGEELSRRKVATALGITDADVLRALHSAQLKVDRFALLFVSDRLCARRAEAIGALARLEARGGDLEQARAHLAHCRDCLLAFRTQRAALGRRVASVLPMPAVALAGAAAGHAGMRLGHARDLAAAAKRHASALAGRGPKTSMGAEAVAGAGASGAAATKVAIGLCVTAAAGGGAVCAQTFGLFTDPTHPKAKTARVHHAHARTAVRDAAALAATHDPPPAPAQAATAASTPTAPQSAPSVARKTHAASSQPSQSKQEFFDAANGSGAPAAPTKPSSVHSASSGGGGLRSSGSSGGSSGGGGSEFFGG
jgi:RNA polymerase sigma factor (sigma-70 family)